MKTHLPSLDETQVQSYISNQKPDRHRESARAAFERITAEHAALCAAENALIEIMNDIDLAGAEKPIREVGIELYNAGAKAISNLAAVRNPSL